MTCKNEKWSICFDSSRTIIYLDGDKVFDEPSIVSTDKAGQFVEIGEDAVEDESNNHTQITPLSDGVVIDFEATVFFFKTIFKKKLNRKRKIQLIRVTLQEKLYAVEERAIREALEKISKEVILVYPSGELVGKKEQYSTPKTSSNIIADEIVSIIKMVGLAIVFAAIYIGVFLIYHHNDRKPVSEVEWGQSCYDDMNAIKGNYDLDWERIYYDNWMSENVDEFHKFRIREHEQEELDYVNWRRTHDFDDTTLLQSALQKVDQNERMLQAEENKIRITNAKEDLMIHIKYCILFFVIITLVGRYVKKSVQWVADNITKTRP